MSEQRQRTTREYTAQCCIVGGGPAGMMAALLLARQGIEVVVLEKHPDFFRDFRGDTIHPATLELLDELGLVDAFLSLPHTKMERVTMATPSGDVTFADFTRLGRYGYIAFVPQWDFLEFIARELSRYPSFRLLRPAEVTSVLTEGDRVVGVRATAPDGVVEVRADLVIAADGRHSVVRDIRRREIVVRSAPVDVLWFRLSRRPDDAVAFFRKTALGVLISIDRGAYWQLAYVIPSGGYDEVRARGLRSFREAIAEIAPQLSDRLGEIRRWDDVKLLSVRVDRLRRWYEPGLLFIGDAAHAMSPAGGVGINLAIQDAVAAANIVGPALASGKTSLRDLRRVQRRRGLPVRIVQTFQVRMLKDLYPTRSANASAREPVVIELFRRVPLLSRLAGRLIGRGIRPEHVSNAIREAVRPALRDHGDAHRITRTSSTS